MASGLVIPNDLLVHAISMAAQQCLTTADVKAMTMLTAKEAADLLKISPASFRKIAPECIDLGAKLPRWRLSDIEALVESRRIKQPVK